MSSDIQLRPWFVHVPLAMAPHPQRQCLEPAPVPRPDGQPHPAGERLPSRAGPNPTAREPDGPKGCGQGRLRPKGAGPVAGPLGFGHKVKTPDEMLDLATHIIDTKHGTLDPAEFDDRHEAPQADLVKAKLAGRKTLAQGPERRGRSSIC